MFLPESEVETNNAAGDKGELGGESGPLQFVWRVVELYDQITCDGVSIAL